MKGGQRHPEAGNEWNGSTPSEFVSIFLERRQDVSFRDLLGKSSGIVGGIPAISGVLKLENERISV